MYDWANSAFATTILAAILPVYYRSVAGAGLPGNTATVYWGYTTSAALLIVAVLSPVLGAMADFEGAKKRYLGYFAALGITGTGLLYFAGEGQWLLASLFFILGNVGYAGANVFYDALLTHIAEPEEMDRVSARGFALGYLGGGILLGINLWMIAQAPPGQTGLMMRWAFVSVAAWWLVFSIPLWRIIPESQAVVYQGEEGKNPVLVSFQRLSRTFEDMRQLREAFKFLIA
jgi:UMF1 family MFS transporter